MSFYTSLTGLNAATTELSVTSNNIANSGTSGFKRSDADFGDIFATSPLQKASSVIGRGVSLKEVSQEFSQGNIEFSANSLDLAITGDGFFPLESPDGTKIYTRNGAFMLNEQNQMVNSAGQALQALPVDSTNKADFGEPMSALAIPRATVSEFLPTTEVELGLNLPSDAAPITEAFNPAKPETYNKTTSLTVYGTSGSSHLATIYYVKTAEATADVPFNKWQTYVYIDDQAVDSALIQASDTAGDQYFVNKYGEVKTQSELLELQKTSAESEKYLVTLGTLYKKYSFDNLSTPTDSQPASVNFAVAEDSVYIDDLNLTNNSDGIDFTAGAMTRTALSNMFSLSIDDSPAIKVGLEHLAGSSQKLSGSEIAFELTNVINERFGDGKSFDFSATASRPLKITRVTAAGAVTTTSLSMPTILNAHSSADYVNNQVAAEPLAYAIDAALGAINGFNDISVSYDAASQGFRFLQANSGTDSIYLSSGASGTATNAVFGVAAQTVDGSGNITSYGTLLPALDTDASDVILKNVLPNGTAFTAANNQRYGISVSYTEGKFIVASGTTGDESSLEISSVSTMAQNLLGMEANGHVVQAETSQINNLPAVRGQLSSPAVVTGNQMGVDPRKSFLVNTDNQNVTVIVDGISAQIQLTLGQYSIGTFTEHLQSKINLMADALGRSVSGVTVGFDEGSESLVITGATASDSSFIQVAGHADWGLEDIDAGFGKTSSYIELVPDTSGTSEVYVTQDNAGNWIETTDKADFDDEDIPYWTPIFLDKGELTFDTSGTLVSPIGGAKLESDNITGGSINLAYNNSTQFNSPFAVLSQSQNGAPEGDLVGVNIGDDGLVVASYSNGSQKSLGKIILANFATPKGLRQVGDTSYSATSGSGDATLGEPGAAGFGTIRAGARERSNVDLTAELVDLITAQRNFQANAKAIETSSSLTQTIINIRG
ncbi:MAG: flagellar hook-basal body complex protein [Porticoccaceae bacterium]|nr:flagellar hook-basal body complex protein [Porticoccaceae bacterium]